MKTRIFRTNTSTYTVERREDGTLDVRRAYVYYGGEWKQQSSPEPIMDAGMFINQQGGIEALWEKCERVENIDTEIERVNMVLRKENRERKERHEQMAEEANKKIDEDYHRLFDGKEIVETTAESVYVLLRYLNNQNWGVWEMPKMTIGYSCNQYDCDGKQATTIKLDKPIIVLGEAGTMFQVGAPVGHLTKYRRIIP